MKIAVFIERENKRIKVDLPRSSNVRSLLEKLKINPVNTLVSINNEICTDQEVLKDDDKVELFSVVSGG